MELLRPQPMTELQRHQQIISLAISKQDWPAIDKAKWLGANALIFQGKKDVAAAYNRAAHLQWIYHYVHDSNLSSKELFRTFKSRKFSPSELTEAVRYDSSFNANEKIRLVRQLAGNYKQINSDLPKLVALIINESKLNVQAKLSLLADWQRKYPGSEELSAAILDQKSYARSQKEDSTPFLPRPSPASPRPAPGQYPGQDLMAGYGITIESLMSDKWVAAYGQSDGLGPQRKKELLSSFFKDMAEMAELHWTHRGHTFKFGGLTLHGPDMRVKFPELVSQLALSYLEAEVRFNESASLPLEQRVRLAHMYQSFVGKETKFYVDAQGYTNNKSNGTGPFQLTGICIYALSIEKLGDIRNKILRWGGRPFSSQLARYWEPAQNRWVSLVQVQTPAPKKNRRGQVVGYKPIRVEPEARPIPPPGGDIIVRGPYFKDELSNPAKAIRVASAAMIMYGAHPGMTYSELEQVAERYNGNNRKIKTPRGVMKVKEEYKQDVKARSQLSDKLSQLSP